MFYLIFYTCWRGVRSYFIYISWERATYLFPAKLIQKYSKMYITFIYHFSLYILFYRILFYRMMQHEKNRACRFSRSILIVSTRFRSLMHIEQITRIAYVTLNPPNSVAESNILMSKFFLLDHRSFYRYHVVGLDCF